MQLLKSRPVHENKHTTVIMTKIDQIEAKCRGSLNQDAGGKHMLSRIKEGVNELYKYYLSVMETCHDNRNQSALLAFRQS